MFLTGVVSIEDTYKDSVIWAHGGGLLPDPVRLRRAGGG